MAILNELVLGSPGRINGDLSEPEQNIYTTSTTQNHLVGTLLEYEDGRRFRYAKANGALTKALMTQTAVVETKFVAIAQTGHAQVAGAVDINVLVTTGSARAENDLVGGYIVATKVNDIGGMYKIVASKLRSTDTILDLKLEHGLAVAWAATTEIIIAPNKWQDVVVFPTTATGQATGVPLVAVADNEFFWSQTAGPAPYVASTTNALVIGSDAGPPAAVAGSCLLNTTLVQRWGKIEVLATADAEAGIINLSLES